MSGSLILLNILGAVALLLWGLRMIRTAAERALGSDLDRHLRRIAGSRPRAFVVGAIGAALLQSSTAVVLLGAGFVARARLTLAAGLAVALGADVGSAVAAQVLSRDIHAAVPALLLAGYVLFQWSTAKRVRNAGRALIGLALVLTALGMVVATSRALSGSGTVVTVMAALAGEPVLAILIAALLTWIAHSSLAIVLLIASMAGAGAMDAEGALYMLLGANLGAALPPLTASLAEPIDGRRVPFGNLVFRLAGVAGLVWLVPAFQGLMAGTGAGTVVVLGHLGFNIVIAAAALPFAGLAARLLERVFPGVPEVERPLAAPRHLDPDALANPAHALGNGRREAVRLADIVQEMIDASEESFQPDATPERLAAISVREDAVDSLNTAIKFYVTDLTRAPLSDAESRQAHTVIAFSTNMEHIADIVDRNLRRLADRKRKAGLKFSDEGAAEIADIYARLRAAMQLAVSAFMSDDEEIADQIIADKRTFRDEEQEANQRHLGRLREGNIASIDTSSIHLDVLRDLKRVHSHLTAIAYAIADRPDPSIAIEC